MRPSCVIATVAISMRLCAGVALAQSSASASGHWEGNIDVPGQPLAISVELSTTAGGAWNGAITIPAQHVSAFPLSDIRDIRYEGDQIVFDWKDGGKHQIFGGTKVNGGRVSNSFRREDAERFVEAVRARLAR